MDRARNKGRYERSVDRESNRSTSSIGSVLLESRIE